ncbi:MULTISPECIES: recombinase family protein [Methylorubrum]|uniref:recombinase family protein n=1 Tax=Methylorubrum TaxID=2282523 RepID=UPI0020A22D0B
MRIGYARVSTDEQNLALQLDALRAAGCEMIHEDHGLSGTAAKRPGLTAALAALKPGDVLTVWRVDRLGRSTASLALLLDELHARGVEFCSIMDQMDTTTATGRMIYGVMSVMAQLERDLISERTRAGMKASKRRGKHVGRPASITPDKLDLAHKLLADGKGKAATARAIDVSPATLRRHLNARA